MLYNKKRLCKRRYIRSRVTLYMDKFWHGRVRWSWQKHSGFLWWLKHGIFASFTWEYSRCVRIFGIQINWIFYELDDLTEAYEEGRKFPFHKVKRYYYDDYQWQDEATQHFKIYERYKRYVDYLRSK